MSERGQQGSPGGPDRQGRPERPARSGPPSDAGTPQTPSTPAAPRVPAGVLDEGPSAGKFAGLGLQLLLSILLFLYLGKWLDRKLGTAPWLLVLGVFLGASAGFYSLYRQLTAAQRADDERRAAARRDAGVTGRGPGA